MSDYSSSIVWVVLIIALAFLAYSGQQNERTVKAEEARHLTCENIAYRDCLDKGVIIGGIESCKNAAIELCRGKK